MKRICIQWPRFGPYHLARLDATHAYFKERGVEVIGLETAVHDDTYEWRIEDKTTAFQREQVFRDKSHEQLNPREVERVITATLDRLNPDAVAIQSYSFPDARACMRWCRDHRHIAVVMLDSKEDDAERSVWRERVKSILLSQYDAALVAGTPHQRYVEKLGFPTEAIFRGYDVVDNDFFRRGAEEARRNRFSYHHLPGLETNTPFFLTSNRFIERKNLNRLLIAYKKYRIQTSKPWRLVMLGNGPQRPALETLINKHAIEGVTLAGFRQIEEIPVYYGVAGAFVHPALIDQWALVVNEAMAAGLPILISTGAGCAEDLVFDGENGYRFDPQNDDLLTRLMVQISSPEMDQQAMGRRSQDVIASWPLERFAEALWQAVQAGQARADRTLIPSARILLWLLRQATRSMTAFHTVEA